ncbi:hypothetical protein EYC84_009764 [Monilinia fructicola]|uniref:Uncharacterized protein n=1 Tax=Monilinia fructicola TaxID=38448 RepID=A0A5M9JFL2_MONFR|nr:hypothetical protein EYC84_009764 [Monilinia fructicola]
MYDKRAVQTRNTARITKVAVLINSHQASTLLTAIVQSQQLYSSSSKLPHPESLPNIVDDNTNDIHQFNGYPFPSY